MTLRTALTLVMLPVVLGVCAMPASAQAWLPPKGEGAVSLIYQDMFDRYHQFPGIGKVDVGPTTSRSMLFDVTYGLTDKMAVSIGIPWVSARYVGPSPHPIADLSGPRPTFFGAAPADNGRFHGTLQDIRVDVRYNLTTKGVTLTPFIGTSAPTRAYTTLAHAAPGTRQKQLQLGLSAAKMLDGITPGLFVQGRYAFAFVERPIDIRTNRSSAGVEIGYFVTPRLRVLALGAGQLSHGGIDMIRNPQRNLPPEQFLHHDAITRINYLNLGAGAAYSLTEKVDLFGSMIRTVAARNGHLVDRGISLGMSWSFAVRRGDRAIGRSAQSLARCICAKSAS